MTPEYPDGTYYYVATDSFPFIPRFFHGKPDKSFEKQMGPPPGGPGGRPPGGRRRAAVVAGRLDREIANSLHAELHSSHHRSCPVHNDRGRWRCRTGNALRTPSLSARGVGRVVFGCARLPVMEPVISAG